MTGTQEAPRRRREPGILPESVVDWALLGARRPRAQDRAIDGVLLVLMLINATLRVEPGHPTLLGSALTLAARAPLSIGGPAGGAPPGSSCWRCVPSRGRGRSCPPGSSASAG